MENRRKPIIYVAVVLVAVVAGYFIYDNFLAPDPVGEIGIHQGNLLLDQSVPNIDGSGSVSFSDYEGSIVVIDFMAPWCQPCKTQIPVLRAVESIEGVEVLTINVDPSYDMEYLMNFGEEEGITWFFGHSPETALEFEVAGIPTVLVVDQEGMIVNRAFFTTIQDFERILTPLID